MKFDNVWVMYGVGFCMGQFFFLKYTVVYGLALTWTKAEGYETPNPPRCIAHICLYSDMWRYFDEGLYLFIRRWQFSFYKRELSCNLNSLNVFDNGISGTFMIHASSTHFPHHFCRKWCTLFFVSYLFSFGMEWIIQYSCGPC